MDLIYLLIALVVILWIAFSPDPLASAIRTRFVGAKARAAAALDDAVDRVEAAEASNENQLAKANAALVDIMGMRVAIQNKVDLATGAARKWQTAAENAASVQKQDLVVEALTRKNAAAADLDSLQTQLTFLCKKEAEVQNAVNALQKRKAQLKEQRVQIKTRAKTAVTTLGVNELLAGVDLSGNNKDVTRAFEIVDDLEAKSGAMAEIAKTATAKQRMDEELEALAHPQTSVDTEAAELLAKFATKQPA